MLKLHQIYLQNIILIFIVLFIIISIENYFIDSKQLFFCVSLISFLIAFVVLKQLIANTSKSLQNEVSNIILFLKNLTKKQKQESITSDYSEELKYITSLISKIAHILIKQNTHKEKYTKKLESLNNQKDEIISAISHEFKNPITIINGYSQTLLNDPNLPKNLQKKFLEKIYKNGIKLTNLIDTLRLAIKLDQNTQKFTFEMIDIFDLTNEIVEDIKDSYNRNIKIFGKTTKIQADKVLLGIAIRNLIENAIKYSEDEILVIITNSSLCIIDKGIGIKEDDILKITQKFYRVSNNTWNNSLGLGLSIVSNIVKLHNFNLTIKSQLHKGSEFCIKFT